MSLLGGTYGSGEREVNPEAEALHELFLHLGPTGGIKLTTFFGRRSKEWPTASAVTVHHSEVTRSHLINARTSRKRQHLRSETVETQANHHFPPVPVVQVLWLSCYKTIYEISSI